MHSLGIKGAKDWSQKETLKIIRESSYFVSKVQNSSWKGGQSSLYCKITLVGIINQKEQEFRVNFLEKLSLWGMEDKSTGPWRNSQSLEESRETDMEQNSIGHNEVWCLIESEVPEAWERYTCLGKAGTGRHQTWLSLCWMTHVFLFLKKDNVNPFSQPPSSQPH